MRPSLASALASTLLPALLTAQEPPADLVLVNARVVTLSPTPTRAEAVAIRGDRIALVGTDVEARRLAGPETRIVDLEGQLLLPGLIDSHTHFLSGSLSLDQVDLSGASLPQIQERLRKRARARPGPEWIVGRGWSYSAIPERLPDRRDLDAAVADRPVYLVAYDGHTAWVNTRALEMAGIDERTAQPEFGEVALDASGAPTGLLKEGGAMSLVRAHIPEPSPRARRNALLAGLAAARRFGVTAIQNASGSAEELALYRELDREGLLTLRTRTALRAGGETTGAELDEIERLRERFREGNVRAGTVKLFVDGVVETHTAAMLEPYADDPSTRGTPAISQEDLDRLVAELDRRRFQIYIHSIGDRGVRMTLDAFERARRNNPDFDRRHRVDHIEVLSPEDVPRFAEPSVLASMQAAHYFPTPGVVRGVWQTNVGAERLPMAFAWETLAEAGARLCFGSDWPVATLNPMIGLRNAVARSDQHLTVERALGAYTIDAAYCGGLESEIGSIEKGKLADLVVLSRDLFAIDPGEIASVEVRLTVFDGRIVYRAP